MLEAKSIYLGGEILAALNCNYDSSIDLGLNCPFCSRPVFLVQGFNRSARGKAQAVAPHFSHFKADSELGRDCEARSLSKEGRAFIQKLGAEARGQRLKVYNRRLWKMLTWRKEFLKGTGNMDCLRKISDHLHTSEIWLGRSREELMQFLRDQAETLTPYKIKAQPQFQNISEEGAAAIAKEILEGLDSKLQWVIGVEVIEYLHTPEARPVFDKLINMAILDAIDLNQAKERGEGTHNLSLETNIVHHFALASIAFTPWEAALAHFAKPQSGEGFGR